MSYEKVFWISVRRTFGVAVAALALVPAAHASGPRIFRPSDAPTPPEVVQACAPSATANMSYNNGQVMQSVTVYTIFWTPNGTISQGFRDLVNRYFQDIGGSAFYNVNVQYYQNPGPAYMQNASAFGGTWVDTTNAYPGGRGTGADPLLDQDVRDEVTRALAANPGWGPPGLTRMYFVYTEKGIESMSGSDCTGGVTCTGNQYCAYHWSFKSGSDDVIYANMPYVNTWNNCGRAEIVSSPNGDLDADMEVSTTSHEHFEAATDPLGGGWFDCDGTGEDGDKCAYRYGTQQADGHNVVMNGHAYIAQQEWSNADNDGMTGYSGCVTRYQANVDMAVSASDSPDPVDTGSTLSFSIAVTNGSAAFEGSDLALSDYTPAGTRFSGLTPAPGWSCSVPPAGGTGAISCKTLSVPKSGTASFTLDTTVSCSLADGTTIGNTASITSTSSDKNAANDSASTTTTVHNPPPAVSCPAPVTAECSSPCGTSATEEPIATFLKGATVTDNCPGASIANDAPSCFALGMDPVTFTATDSGGATSSCSASVKVQDTTPPTIAVTLDRTTLWPPDHSLVPINATVTVTDVCDPNVKFRLVSVTSSEPDNGVADGDTNADIQGVAYGTADAQVYLRSERAGSGPGRVYTIRYQGYDASGNTADAVVRVTVPHDM